MLLITVPWVSKGGLVDPLESIASAAVRECKEETGIDTDFVALSAFRESQVCLVVTVSLATATNCFISVPTDLQSQSEGSIWNIGLLLYCNPEIK